MTEAPNTPSGLILPATEIQPTPLYQYYNEIGLEEVKQYILLFYGGSGTGKTILASMMPEPIFISVDRGAMGGLLSAVSVSGRKFKQVKINSYAQLTGLYPLLAAGAGKDFKTIIIDSLTSLNQLVVKDIVALTAKEVPVFQDWNLAVARMRTMLDRITSMNAHIVFTATEQMHKDEPTGKISGLPNLPGKLATELPAAVDIVIRTHTVSSFDPNNFKRIVKFMGSTTPDDVWYAKDRSGTLAAEIALSDEAGKPTFKALEHLFAAKGEQS